MTLEKYAQEKLERKEHAEKEMKYELWKKEKAEEKEEAWEEVRGS